MINKTATNKNKITKTKVDFNKTNQMSLILFKDKIKPITKYRTNKYTNDDLASFSLIGLRVT